MKTVYLTTFENDIQATMLKDILHDNGIECLIKNEILNSVMPYGPGFQIEMHVLEDDYDRAMELLKEAFPERVGES